jgi:hypothetical protein
MYVGGGGAVASVLVYTAEPPEVVGCACCYGGGDQVRDHDMQWCGGGVGVDGERVLRPIYRFQKVVSQVDGPWIVPVPHVWVVGGAFGCAPTPPVPGLWFVSGGVNFEKEMT